MKKILIATILLFIFTGCGETDTNNSNTNYSKVGGHNEEPSQ